MLQREARGQEVGTSSKIGDVSKEEALQYLILRKIDEELAARIYELVGGRMIYLKHMADKIGGKGTFEGMCMLYRKRIGSHCLYRSTPGDVLQGRESTRVC